MGDYRLRIKRESNPGEQLDLDGVMWQIRPTQAQSIEIWRPLRKDEYGAVTTYAKAAGSASLSLELVDAEGTVIWTSSGARFDYVSVGLDMSTGVPTGLRENYWFAGEVEWGAV